VRRCRVRSRSSRSGLQKPWPCAAYRAVASGGIACCDEISLRPVGSSWCNGQARERSL
jgi:hypothetical protein